MTPRIGVLLNFDPDITSALPPPFPTPSLHHNHRQYFSCALATPSRPPPHEGDNIFAAGLGCGSCSCELRE